MRAENRWTFRKLRQPPNNYGHHDKKRERRSHEVLKLSRQLEGGPFKWGGRSREEAAPKTMIGDYFLDADVLWPKALSKCSAQQVKATKHPWESHNSGQGAGTAVLRDGTANTAQWHHWKLSKEKPGPCHLWDFHLWILSPHCSGRARTTSAFRHQTDWREARAFFYTHSSPQASELLGEEALSSVGEGEDDLWQVHRKQTHGKKLTLLETQTV